MHSTHFYGRHEIYDEDDVDDEEEEQKDGDEEDDRDNDDMDNPHKTVCLYLVLFAIVEERTLLWTAETC